MAITKTQGVWVSALEPPEFAGNFMCKAIEAGFEKELMLRYEDSLWHAGEQSSVELELVSWYKHEVINVLQSQNEFGFQCPFTEVALLAVLTYEAATCRLITVDETIELLSDNLKFRGIASDSCSDVLKQQIQYYLGMHPDYYCQIMAKTEASLIQHRTKAI